MAVWLIECPVCGHRYQTLVLDGTTLPEVWHCSRCGEFTAIPLGKTADVHLLELEHGGGCPCCGSGKLNSQEI